jgi:hypothetical protein
MEQKFIEALGTKVTIQGDIAKGHIRIEYYSFDHFLPYSSPMGATMLSILGRQKRRP